MGQPATGNAKPQRPFAIRLGPWLDRLRYETLFTASALARAYADLYRSVLDARRAKG